MGADIAVFVKQRPDTQPSCRHNLPAHCKAVELYKVSLLSELKGKARKQFKSGF